MNKHTPPLKPEFTGPSLIEGNSEKLKPAVPVRSRSGTHRTEKAYAFFAIEKGTRFVRRFRLILRDGRTVSMPYAHLPVIVYDPNGRLEIKTGEVSIIITGRSLHILADWLNEEKLLWIKESSSGLDDQEANVFVSGIEIEGDLVV